VEVYYRLVGYYPGTPETAVPYHLPQHQPAQSAPPGSFSGQCERNDGKKWRCRQPAVVGLYRLNPVETHSA
jgi:hypothetical protein